MTKNKIASTEEAWETGQLGASEANAKPVTKDVEVKIDASLKANQTPFDPTGYLGDEEAIAEFLKASEALGDAVVLAHALSVAEAARAKLTAQ